MPPEPSTPCDPIKEVLTEVGCVPKDPIQFIQRFYGVGLGILGGLSILFLMYGGYLIMTSQGDHGQLTNGKSYIKYAIIGLFLSIFGFVLVQVVTVDILHVPGFGA